MFRIGSLQRKIPRLAMPLSFKIGSAASPVSIDIGDSTQADVLTALANNSPFPMREIHLGNIAATLSTSSAAFVPAPGASVSLKASASFSSGLAVYQSPKQILSLLPLDPAISLDFQMSPNDRLMMLSFAATSSGSLNGTYPIGVVGSASVGLTGQLDDAFAVIHRFDKDVGAQDALRAVVDSLRLPSQIKSASDLQPATWIVSEVDGTLALSLAAKLGYSLSKSDKTRWLGKSHTLGVKIDTALTATLGFTAGGRFLLVVSRPSSDAASHTLCLKLMKQRRNGWNIGLELSAGIQASPGLPSSTDDFVSGVFGIYGPQVVKDLHAIEDWTTGDLGENLAALTTETAKRLLSSITKSDSGSDLAQATRILKEALSAWDDLATNGSSEVQALVWKILGDPSASERQAVVEFLTNLADRKKFTQTISKALQSLENRNWLLAIADALGSASGLILSQRQIDVSTYASLILKVLNGKVLDALKIFIGSKFDVGTICSVTDPASLDEWVQRRLAALLDQTVLSSPDLKKIQQAFQSVGKTANDIYSKVKSAINTRYSIDFATKYEMNTGDSALLDLEFDLSRSSAQDVFHRILTTAGATADLFDNSAPIDGLTIHEAMLTHEIHSVATTHFGFLSFTADSHSLNDTVANLTIEQNGARLVGYVRSKDQAMTDRFASILNLADTLTVEGHQLTPASLGSISYEMRIVGRSMSQVELKGNTTNFATSYLQDKFSTQAVYEEKFLKTLIQSISNSSSSAVNNYGDMAISMQVALTSDLLDGWLVNRDSATLKATQAAASRCIQRCLRRFTSLIYLQNPNNLKTINAASPLLVWSALPLCAGVDWDQSRGMLNAIDTEKEPYWKYADSKLVCAMVNLNATATNLQPALSSAYDRLMALDESYDASFFAPSPGTVAHLRNMILSSTSGGQSRACLQALLFSEAQVALGVAKALESAAKIASSSAGQDARAEMKDHLAQFARDVTLAMNSGNTNLYVGNQLRLFGPMLLVELAKVLSPATSRTKRSAMLQLISLKPGHSFDLSTFLTGSFPDLKEVLVGQTVVSDSV